MNRRAQRQAKAKAWFKANNKAGDRSLRKPKPVPLHPLAKLLAKVEVDS